MFGEPCKNVKRNAKNLLTKGFWIIIIEYGFLKMFCGVIL